MLLPAVLPAAVRADTARPLLLQNASHRHSVSLNGDWHVIVDPRDAGIGREYFTNANPYGATNTRVIEYDFATAPTLHVPGDWNSQRADLLFYEGTVWYQRTFSYHIAPGRRTFFHVGAANYTTRVWMNGQDLCEHEGGFTPFDCDATRLLKDGENFVVVSVNNVRTPDNIPALVYDWWNYGGLTRDVSLIDLPAAFIEDYSLRLDRGSGNRILASVRMSTEAAGETVTVRIPELRIVQTATTDASGLARIAFDAAGLERWSPEHPRLYRVELSSGSDRIEDEIGFRTLEVRGLDILLNGTPIFFRGISLHGEAPNRPGRAHGEDDAQILLGWAKELGCNYIRLAHYPHDESEVRLADRLGLLVWSEIPVFQGINFASDTVRAKANHLLEEMIARDRNRVAVAFWSLTNESPITPDRNAAIHEMAALARKLDDSRLIAGATNQFKKPDSHTLIFDDPLIQEIDVFGVNEYIGWYQGVATDLDTMKWTNTYSKPMIVSEFGGDAKQGLHGSPDQRWTEEFQENLYQHQIAAIRKLPFARGMSPWILKDFRSPVRQLTGIQDGYNRKGLISDKGERKKAFYVLQHFYQELASNKKDGK
jgi:beta-glucuronidase